MRRVPRALTGVAATLALLTLTACGAVGPESGDSGNETTATFSGEVTCENIDAELESIGSDVSTASDSAASDPAGFISELQNAFERLGALTEATSDPELKSHLQGVQDAAGDLLDSVTSGEILGDLGSPQTKITDIISAMDEVDTYCTGNS
jgi:hypothetical protein